MLPIPLPSLINLFQATNNSVNITTPGILSPHEEFSWRPLQTVSRFYTFLSLYIHLIINSLKIFPIFLLLQPLLKYISKKLQILRSSSLPLPPRKHHYISHVRRIYIYILRVYFYIGERSGHRNGVWRGCIIVTVHNGTARAGCVS